MAEDFHSRSDKKGPTISLFKIKDGDCIGGYTKAQWSSDNKLVEDEAAMLFNLSSCRCFPHQQGNAIKCGSDLGPVFIGERFNGDLAAYEPFNGEKKCESNANRLGYKIPLEDGKNALTNKVNRKFTITEIEVWGVTFVDCNI